MHGCKSCTIWRKDVMNFDVLIYLFLWAVLSNSSGICGYCEMFQSTEGCLVFFSGCPTVRACAHQQESQEKNGIKINKYFTGRGLVHAMTDTVNPHSPQLSSLAWLSSCCRSVSSLHSCRACIVHFWSLWTRQTMKSYLYCYVYLRQSIRFLSFF